jgi:hypothetical protein
MHGDQQDGNVGRLDGEGECKPAELAKGRVGANAAQGEADEGENHEDQGPKTVALDQQQD